ncbi:MAG TPA: ACP S-malonyltransferase, partial [Candidatus Kapabacteria bacterium]|nr:ACP S-malonyltransferase [Candidatus Kapabacteria bacterium]
KAFVFPGQGSQYVGMAKEFADAAPGARVMLEEADDLLHVHLSKTMLEGPEELLKQTDYTQPAIFLHSMIAYQFSNLEERPAAVAGHSLGEFSALCVAEAFSFEDALKLVHLRGTLMAEAGKRKPGTMAAIIGMEEKVLRDLCESVETETDHIVRPANFNSPGQIVISGSVDGVHETMRRAKLAGIRIVKELPVSGAFHSPLMQYAADGLKEALDSTEIVVPSVPVYANVTAELHGDVASIRQRLVEQLTSPVLWEQSVRSMNRDGIKEFVEIGPGKVLQGLITRTVSDAIVSGIEKPTASD